MLRFLSSGYKKTDFETLERLAKLDSLFLKDNELGNTTLKLYEQTLSSPDFTPKSLYKNLIKNSIPLKPNILEHETSLNYAQNLKILPLNDLLMLKNDPLEINLDSIRNIFTRVNHSKLYYPMELLTDDIQKTVNIVPLLMTQLFKNIGSIKLEEFNTMAENIYFVFHFHENFSSLQLNQEALENAKKNIIDVLVKSNIKEILRFINVTRLFYKKYEVPSQVISHLIQAEKKIDELNDEEILDFLLIYPIGHDVDHLKYFSEFIELSYKISIEKLADLLELMKKCGYRIPYKMIKRLDLQSSNLFDDKPCKEITGHVQRIIDTGVISRNIVDNACFHMQKAYLKEPENQDLLYDFLMVFHQSNNLNLLVQNQIFISDLIQITPVLPIKKQLKIVSSLLFHLKNYEILESLAETLEKSDISELKPFNSEIVSTQETILGFHRESPVFNYQFGSYKFLENKSIKKLGKVLNSILERNDPFSPSVYKFYTSNISADLPSFELVSSVQKSNKEWAKCLWYVKDHYDVKDIAKVALANHELKVNDTEYLYYLTSISPEKLDIKSLQFSSFILALVYNTSSNYVYNPDIQINFSELPTDAIIKSIIMLHSYNDFNKIRIGLEFLGFIPDDQPKIPVSLIKELLVCLNALDKSQLNYFSIGTIINKYINELNEDDLLNINSILFHSPDSLKEKLNFKKDVFEYNRSKVLESAKSFKTDLNKKPSSNTLQHLKKLEFLNFANFDFILSLLEDSKFSDEEGVKIKVILEILTNTSPNLPVVKSLFSYIKAKNLWQKFNFQDKCNYLFVSLYSGIGCSAKKKDEVLDKLYFRSRQDDLLLHPDNGLLYYKPFIHTTRFEPRQITSNSLYKKENSAVFTEKAEMPDDEVLKYLKSLAVLNKVEKPRTADIEEAVKLYYRKRNLNVNFFNRKLAVHGDLAEVFGDENITENKIEQNTGWVLDFWVEKYKLGVNVLCESDFYIGQDLKPRISCLSEVRCKQVEESLGVKVLVIDFNSWDIMKKQAKLDYIKSYIVNTI